MNQKRLNIGLFISDIENAFDSAVCNGVMQGANEVDANLFIFPGMYLKGQYFHKEYSKCTYQYNTVFSYANKSNIDVLLVLLGTIGTVISEREKKTFLDMYQDIPIMLLASEKKGYSSVIFDNKSGLRDGIEDLIVNKNCKSIAMVSGPITSGDAVERLEVYKEVLRNHNIEYDENKVVYGNFSEYSENIVKELLDRNDKLDAIVFANDQMAIGGYKVMKERGIKIGSDIYVMGFDDSPATMMMVPNLTTVKANAFEIGRIGVIEAVNLVSTGIERKKFVKTSLIKRESTGFVETDYIYNLEKKDFSNLLKKNVFNASKMFVNEFFSRENNIVETYEIEPCIELVKYFFEQLKRQSNFDDSNDSVIFYIEKILENKTDDAETLNKMLSLFDELRKYVKIYMPAKLLIAEKNLYDYLSHILIVISAKKKVKELEMNEFLFQSNSIAKDMISYGEGNDKSYYTVNDKLIRLGFRSAYLYSFKTPFINTNSKIWHDWQIPNMIQLKSYYNDYSAIQIVKESEQEMPSTELFTHKFMPADRRYTMLINIIFINEEQLGLLLCEADYRHMSLLPSLLAQLSSSFKIIYMLKVQKEIQKKLRNSLSKVKENNEMLETISKSDELTGIYNRRGFFEMACKLAVNSKSLGKKGIIIFADLDNLKTINDHFGHDDGDFAIRTAADILKEAVRTSDIVARIGGDEFAVLAVSESSITGETITKRIKKLCKKFNDKCDKEYYVELSVGYSEFVCDETIEIEKYLDLSDEMLYQDKKLKRKSIIKNSKDNL